MFFGAQFSLYPMSAGFVADIGRGIAALEAHGQVLRRETDDLSTLLVGPPDAVVQAMRDAFDAFKDVVARFPDSKYAPDAGARMRYLVNSLSAHEVHVARYYYARGAYVAASNRARFALQTHPQTPALEEGLFILVKSYDALGLNHLRDDANQVMLKNFPKSAYLRGATKVDEPWWKLWNLLK